MLTMTFFDIYKDLKLFEDNTVAFFSTLKPIKTPCHLTLSQMASSSRSMKIKILDKQNMSSYTSVMVTEAL